MDNLFELINCQPACPDNFGELVEGGVNSKPYRLRQAANDTSRCFLFFN